MPSYQKLGSFIKWEHSLFSLPLLFAGAFLAPAGSDLKNLDGSRLFFIVLAGLGARAAALALNRLIDRGIDARNPRTMNRELPSGHMTPTQGWGVVVVGSALYFFAAAKLGRVCLMLSPLPLAVFVIYPLLKRVTWGAHFGVGLGLALAPLGGYVGMQAALPTEPGPWWLAGFTLCWVAGFDVLYATLDESFDRREGLHSMPVRFGGPAAQDAALVLHGLAFFCLAVMRWTAFGNKGHWIWAALAPAALLLALEQKSGYSLDANSPFFKINAWIGVAVLIYIVAGVL